MSHLVIDVLGYFYPIEHLAGAEFVGGNQTTYLNYDDKTVRSISIKALAAGRVIVNSGGYFRLHSDAVDNERFSITTGTEFDDNYLIIAGEKSGSSMNFVPFASTGGLSSAWVLQHSDSSTILASV